MYLSYLGTILQKDTKISFLFPRKNDLASTDSQHMLPWSDLKKSHTIFVALEKGYNSFVISSYVQVAVRKLFAVKKKSRARAALQGRLAIILLTNSIDRALFIHEGP